MTVDNLITVLLRCDNIVGESPLWCTRRQRLYWVDIRAPKLMSCDADGMNLQTWRMPEAIGSFAFCHSDAFVVALKSGIYLHTLGTPDFKLLAAPDANLPQHRFNEGKYDARGRFWAGTMHDVLREPTGSLFRLDANYGCKRVRTGIAVPNSLAWSPDGQRMYFADSETQTIVVFDFDLNDGALGEPRLLVDLRTGAGRPDGCTVDIEGCLWSADVATGRVVRYAPDGREMQSWKFPVTRVTSLTFGGADLRTLYITSARFKLTESELVAQPLAGALFAMQAPVQGLPANLYREGAEACASPPALLASRSETQIKHS